MSDRVFEGRIANEIAPGDRARQERLKATARALVTAVRDGLVRDGSVRLHGFGTFRLRPVAARRGRHPRTGEPINIPAGWRVMFRPAKALRERVEPDRAASLPIGEPHASREAMLAASAAKAARTAGPGAGRIPAAGIAAARIVAPPPAEPERVAAAAMPEPKLSVQGPLPPGPADLEADSRVTRSPAALTRAPAANAPSAPDEPVGEAATGGQQQTLRHETRPTSVTDARPRRSGDRSVQIVLLVLLLVALAWLFRPADTPAPPVAGESATDTPAAAPADVDDGTQGASATVDPDAAGEPVIAAADPEAHTGERDTATSGGGESGIGEEGASAGEPRSGATTSTPAPEAGREPAAATRDAATAAADVEVPRPAAGPATDGGVEASPSRASLSGASGSGGATARAGTVASVDDGAATLTPGTGDQAPPTAEATTEGAAASAGVDTTGSAGSARASSGANAAAYFPGRDYTVRAGDTLWDLADRNYVNPYYWPHIWNHNGGIANPDRLEVQQGLWLPTLEGEPRSLTEADRRSIAEGYLRLYRFFRAQGDANPQYALVGVRYFDASVLPARLQGTAAGHPGDALAAVFRARLEAEFPLD